MQILIPVNILVAICHLLLYDFGVVFNCPSVWLQWQQNSCKDAVHEKRTLLLLEALLEHLILLLRLDAPVYKFVAYNLKKSELMLDI